MKWSTEAKVGAFALAGILLFAGILIELSSLVIFGKSGFHVTGYFKEAEGIEPGNPIHYAGVEVGMVDGITVENGEAVVKLRFYHDAKVPKDADFSIQTTSYGALNSEEFQKFIADQNEALEVVETLKKELL